MNAYLPRIRNFFAILIIFTSLAYSSVALAISSNVIVGTSVMSSLDCRFGPSDDCISVGVDLPFSFPYYNQTYSKIYIDTNGFITLRQPSNYNPGYKAPKSTTIDRDIPKASDTTAPTITPINNPDAVIAPFWDDLDLSSSHGIIRYATMTDTASGVKRFIVQWADAGFWKTPLPMGTFQVILYSTGEIQFQYPTITPQKTTKTRNKGGKATIGIENETGTCGVKYSYQGKDGSGNPKYVATGQAIRFAPPTAATSGCPEYQMNEAATLEDVILSDTPPTLLPSIPDLTGAIPANNATGVSFSNTAFDWQDVSGASKYRILVSIDPEFRTNLNPLTIDDSTLTSSQHIVANLQPNTTYYWTVVALNSVGDSAWATETLCFTTASGGGTVILPTAPDLTTGVTPANNAANVASSRVSFAWQSSANATSYQIIITTDADIDNAEATTLHVNQSGLINASYVSTDLQPNTTYYWTVIATNASGSTRANKVLSFTTASHSGGDSGTGDEGSNSTDPSDPDPRSGGNSERGWAGYAVILHKAGNGTGRIVEQNCPINSYNPVTLYTALPDKGSRFVRWEGNVHSADCYSTQASIAVTVNAIKTCTAVFEKLPVTETEKIAPTQSYNRYPECLAAYRNVVAAYYLPSETQTAQAAVQLTNDNDFPMEVRGSLYHEKGRLLGKYNTVLVAELAPHATQTFSISELRQQVGATTWEGLAWLHITTPNGIRVVNTLRNENKLVENMSLTAENTAYNLPSSAQSDEQAFIVVVNLTNEKVDVYGSLYDKNGELLGNANAALMYNVPARGIRILSMPMLEYMSGAHGWQGRARVQLTAPVIGIKVFNLLLHRDGTLTNMSALADNTLNNLSYGAENFVRITNPTDAVTEVKATLLNDKEQMLGQEAVLTLAPQQTLVLSSAELARKLGASVWEGQAKLVITAPTAIKLMGTVRVAGVLTNILDRIPVEVETKTTAAQ